MSPWQTELLDALMRHCPLYLYWQDREGQYLGANQAFMNRLSVSSLAQLPHLTDSAWLGEEAALYLKQQSKRVLASQQAVSFTLPMPRPPKPLEQAGVFLNWQFHLMPLTNAAGETIGLMSLILELPRELPAPTALPTTSDEAEPRRPMLVANHQAFNIRQTMVQLTERHLPWLALKQVALTLDLAAHLPAELIGDNGHLSQLLEQLLINAIQFTAAGAITLTVKPLAFIDEQLWLQVIIRDTGQGMSKRLVDAANQVLQGQANATTAITMAGLTQTVRHLQALNGQAALASQVGQGTTVMLLLPFGTVKKMRQRTTKAAQASLNPPLLSDWPRLLVVEDNHLALHVLEQRLRQLDLDYVSVNSVQEAVALSRLIPFTIILTDMALTDGSGLTIAITVRALEQQTARPPARIIGLTGLAVESLKIKANEAGIHTLLAKPVTLPALRYVLAPYLKQVPNLNTQTVASLGHELPDNESLLFSLEQYPLWEPGQEDSALSPKTFLFLANLPQEAAALKEAYRVLNWSLIETLAHRLKSTALYSGAIRLRYACQYLERYQKAGHTALQDKLYHQLQQVITETTHAAAVAS